MERAMKNIIQFPLIRMGIAILFIGGGLLIGQTLLSLLRSAFSITNTGMVNILAFILMTPLTYFAYWSYVRYVEKREMLELGRPGAVQEIWRGAFLGFG